ncbi:MAG: MerR family transcriptional regulator [Clostridia bacterium]|nr:MerR family transcriptional regulator [Clostridia bacterium]
MARYFKIGELARLYHLNADTLRYYEEQGLLSPMRAPNGYRLYSPQDVWRLNVIRDLRALGISIESISEHLQAHSTSSTLQLLETEEQLIMQQLEALKRLSDNVRQRKQALRAALSTPVGQIELRTIEARPCYRINKGYRTDEEMDVLIQQLLSFDDQSLYLLGNDEIGSFVSLPATQEGIYREYDGVFVLHSKGNHTIMPGQYLCTCYRGDCAQNSTFIPLLLRYAAAHSLYPEGPLLEIMRTDIHTSGDPQEHLTELQLRVVPDIIHTH